MSWTIRVTDSLGRDIPSLRKKFKEKEQKQALAYAEVIFLESGRGKTKSIFIEHDQ